MANPQGFGRHESSSTVPVNTASTKLPEQVRPGRSTAVAATGSEVSAPPYPKNYPTGPDGVTGDVE